MSARLSERPTARLSGVGNPGPAWPGAEVAGIGESAPAASDERSIPEIVLEAVEAALADAGRGYADIDAVVTASVDLCDGLTASSIAVTEVVGAVMKPETRVAGDGLAALAHAYCLIRSGAYATVLVVAHGKASMAPQDSISAWALDPVLLQSLGCTFEQYSGLQAQALAAADPESVGRWAKRAAAAHGCDRRDVLDSPVIADPLTELMRAPGADGACAVLLVAAPAGPEPAAGGADEARLPGAGRPEGEGGEVAGDRRQVRVISTGYDLDPHLPGDRDLTRWTSLTRALDRALAAAKLDSDDIDQVRASCRYVHEPQLFAAATGLQPPDWTPRGTVPVAAGLANFIRATRDLRRGAGRTALAHGCWGPAGQAQAVALLSAAAAPDAPGPSGPAAVGGPADASRT